MVSLHPLEIVIWPLLVRVPTVLKCAKFMMRSVFLLELRLAKASLPFDAFLNVPPERVTVAELVTMFAGVPVMFRLKSRTHCPPVSALFTIWVTDPTLMTVLGRMFSDPAMLNAPGWEKPAVVVRI